MPAQLWLPNPPPKTPICLGFDGSLNNDWTAIQAETMDGLSFTPRWGPSQMPTYWDPAEHGGVIPHGQVSTAVGELFANFTVVRFYCDPHDWDTDIENWALKHGAERVITWPTNVITKMHAEIVRFENDLKQGLIRHDGDPTAGLHVGNAKKVGKPGQKFILGKPNENQKIDITMAKIMAHTATRDSISSGWEPPKPKPKTRVYRGR